MNSKLFHDNCRNLFISPNPLHTLTSLSLFTPPTILCCLPLIPYTLWQRSLCSLLLPILAALPSSLAHPDSALSVHSSYHSLLPSPHPLHTLTSLSLFNPPTTLCCPSLIPCTTWQHFLCSHLLPLFDSLLSSLAHPHSRALCLYLQLHLCHPNHWNLCSILCLFW